MENITDDKTAAECIASEDVLIGFFNAPWVGPGRLARPNVESIAGKLALRAVEIDVDKCQATAQALNIQSAPTTMLFKKGKVVLELVGARPEHAMHRDIQAALSK